SGVAFNNLIIAVFFQAKDGIRDRHVTGVQTCAIPISLRRRNKPAKKSHNPGSHCCPKNIPRSSPTIAFKSPTKPERRSVTYIVRSEERRVGKECRTGMVM